MIPISQIQTGDLFSNPLFSNTTVPGLVYRVEDVNADEKMLLVQAYSGIDQKIIGKPFWKRNTDRIFSESWRYV